MRQVKSQALRTGVNQDWGVSAFRAPGAGRARLLYIHQLLKSVSRYPVSVAFHATASGAEVQTTFYKYIQRGRLRRTALHRARSGASRSLDLIGKIRLSQGYAISFSRLAAAEAAMLRLTGQKTTVDIRNVYATLGGPARLDLLKIQHYYVFNRYKNLLYLLDLVQGVQVAARFGAGPLFADIFSKGLIRNRRKGQRRFLRLVQAVVNHARDTAQVHCRPDGWRLEVYGKLDGQLRAKRHLLAFGHVSYQRLPTPINYTQRTIDTKFGAFGVKLWIQLPATPVAAVGQLPTPSLALRKPRHRVMKQRRGPRRK